VRHRRHNSRRKSAGFTLLELIVATMLFVVITGVVFAVLIAAQARFKTEKEFMGAFQQANVAIDQITHDIHGAGYPPKMTYTTLTQSNLANAGSYALPVAWSPSYPNTACVIGSCTSPGPFDLILEEDMGAGVQWIRYKLVGTVLYRAVVRKLAGSDPVTTTDPELVPYLENVMNNASPAQIALITTSFPGTFPGGNPVPVFTFPQYAGLPQAPPNIHNINICLIVQAANVDMQTQGARIAIFTGQASTVNPYQ
jgi:type II secretory pathway pseudopilin PulG